MDFFKYEFSAEKKEKRKKFWSQFPLKENRTSESEPMLVLIAEIHDSVSSAVSAMK